MKRARSDCRTWLDWSSIKVIWVVRPICHAYEVGVFITDHFTLNEEVVLCLHETLELFQVNMTTHAIEQLYILQIGHKFIELLLLAAVSQVELLKLLFQLALWACQLVELYILCRDHARDNRQHCNDGLRLFATDRNTVFLKHLLKTFFSIVRVFTHEVEEIIYLFFVVILAKK